LLFWALLILMVVAIYNMFSPAGKQGEEKIAFGTFMQEVSNNPQHIKKVVIKGEHWTGEYSDSHKFRTVGPEKVGVELLSKLDHAGKDQSHSIPYEFEEQDTNSLWTLLLGSWLPMLALVFIFFLFMRQLQAGGGKAMSFGKSKAKLLGEHQNKVT